MSDRKKKSRASDKGVTPAREFPLKTRPDGFVNLFLTLCEEYDVIPLPKLSEIGDSPEVSIGTAKRSTETKIPIQYRSLGQIESEKIVSPIRVAYERSKESNSVEKIECRGCEISVCFFEALNMSIEQFPAVTTLRLPNCRISASGVKRIARMLEKIGCVRDLNLDMNPNISENYFLLCSTSGNIRYLSLKYCNLSDEGVEKIANELRWKSDDSSKLVALNLANNRIGNVGAGHIATMLRTNRSLQSLILSGNGITDVGAALMIQELCMSRLSDDEIVDLRRRNFHRLISNPIVKSSRNSTSIKSARTSRVKKTRKEEPEIVSTIGDPIEHPFVEENRRVGGEIFATGNFELRHLNLDYNRLTNEVLKKISNCVFYQNYMLLGEANKGLLYLSLEGNEIEAEANEDLNDLRELMRERTSS